MSRFDLEGVVFDVDGVLFDTERLSQETWNAVSTELNWPQGRAGLFRIRGAEPGRHPPKDAGPVWAGFSPGDLSAHLLRPLSGADGAGGRPAQAGRPGDPGVSDRPRYSSCPGHLHQSGAHPSAHGDDRSGALLLRRGHRDQVEHSKPDPEIYQLACQALGTAPSRTLAIEDSRNGILSAHAAGMPVVMIPDLIPPAPELERLLFRRCTSLLEVRELLDHLLTT